MTSSSSSNSQSRSPQSLISLTRAQWAFFIRSLISSYIFFFGGIRICRSFQKLPLSSKFLLLLWIILFLLFSCLLCLLSLCLVFTRFSQWISSILVLERNTGEATEASLVQWFADTVFQSTTSSSSSNRSSPTIANLKTIHEQWSFICLPCPQGESSCLICLQENPTIAAEFNTTEENSSSSSSSSTWNWTDRILLTCQCQQMFHRKCILEWFYFGEHESDSSSDIINVTCPGCRHVFSRPQQVLTTTSTSQ